MTEEHHDMIGKWSLEGFNWTCQECGRHVRVDEYGIEIINPGDQTARHTGNVGISTNIELHQPEPWE